MADIQDSVRSEPQTSSRNWAVVGAGVVAAAVVLSALAAIIFADDNGSDGGASSSFDSTDGASGEQVSNENYIDPASVDVGEVGEGDLTVDIEAPASADVVVYLDASAGDISDPSSAAAELLEQIEADQRVAEASFHSGGAIYGFVPDAPALAMGATIVVDLANDDEAEAEFMDAIANADGVAGLGVRER